MDNTNHFCEITRKMNELYISKNSDYGNSFAASVEEFGPVAGLVRISDKFNRVKNLLKPGAVQKVNDEAVIDTLTDLANYSIMLRMEIEKRQGNF